MKRFVMVSLVMLLAVAVSGGLYLCASNAPKGSTRTQQWEYKVVSTIRTAIAAQRSDAKDLISGLEAISQGLENTFNTLGLEGWELVGLGDSVAVFKKPKL